MQIEAEAFLQRVRAFPDDDAPRLVFADWLDEQGDPRGEFIRVQVALASLEAENDRGPADLQLRPDRKNLLARLQDAERILREAHEEEWTAPFRRLATRPRFRRGFVEEINVNAREFVRHANELFSAGPLRHIYLLDIGETLPGVLQCPFLSRLSALTIHASHAGEPLARAVARSEFLTGLKRLDLSRNRFEHDAAEHLASSPTLSQVEELDLRENDLGELGARALAASPHLGSVRVLELRGNRLGPGGAEVLAGSERLASVHHLGLARNEIGGPRLQSLGRAHDLLRVPVLDLSDNGLSAAGIFVILTRPPGPVEPGAVRLLDLDLSNNTDLGDAGARVLALGPHLAGLRTLRLSNCAIGDEGARALAESPHLNQLVSLDLGNNPIGDPGFREYLNPSHLQNLRHLNYPVFGLSSWMRSNLKQRFHHDRV